MGPRNRFQGMNSASLLSLAGRYDNPLPPRFLAPIETLKIPALILRRTNDTVNTRARAGVPKSSAPARNSYLSDNHVRSARSKLPVAGISSVLQACS
jgi:hypothetical protein